MHKWWYSALKLNERGAIGAFYCSRSATSEEKATLVKLYEAGVSPEVIVNQLNADMER